MACTRALGLRRRPRPRARAACGRRPRAALGPRRARRRHRRRPAAHVDLDADLRAFFAFLPPSDKISPRRPAGSFHATTATPSGSSVESKRVVVVVHLDRERPLSDDERTCDGRPARDRQRADHVDREHLVEDGVEVVLDGRPSCPHSSSSRIAGGSPRAGRAARVGVALADSCRPRCAPIARAILTVIGARPAQLADAERARVGPSPASAGEVTVLVCQCRSRAPRAVDSASLRR